MKLGRNLAAGLGSSVYTALIGLAVVPLYLRYLGVEAYGLIGFFATMQAMFSLLDMGLAQTLNRQISRYSVDTNWNRAGNLLHTLATIYWMVAACIAVIVFLFARPIANYWINVESLSPQSATYAIQLIGVVIACRFPIGLYQGALMGLQLNTVTSAVAVAMTTLASGGAVLVLAYIAPSIQLFFAWQALAGIVYALTLRRFAWKVIRTECNPRFDMDELREVWRFAASMAAIAMSAIVFTQLDKVLLSKILSLGEFGCYMLATVIAGALYLLIAPLFNVIYPRFSLLVAKGDEADIRQLYRVGTRLFATALFPVAFVMSAFAREIVTIWTGDATLAEKVAPLLSILSIGTALHGVMYFPYALQLAYGVPRLALKINVLLLSVLAPLTVILASRYGAIGGALAWLILQSAYVPLGCWLTHRKLLEGVGTHWLILDVARPLVVAGIVVLAARALIDLLQPNNMIALVLAACVVMAATAIGLVSSPQAFRLVTSLFRSWRSAVS